MALIDPVLFLGYDLGSHGAKATLRDLSGQVLASVSRSHTIDRPHPGWQEQDPVALWWEEFVDIVRSIKLQVAARPMAEKGPLRLAGIGITGFVPGLCALDRFGLPVRMGIMHTDLRAGAELQQIQQRLNEPVSLGTLLPKLLWIKDHEPDTYARISKVLVPHAYLVYRLTGKMVCDYDTASIYGGIFDASSHSWDEDACSRVGIDPLILPKPVPVTARVGELSPEAAELLSVTQESSVIAGSGDSFASLVGEGAVSPGDLMIYLGTSATRILVQAPLQTIAAGPHYGAGRASFCGRIFSCGESMEHYRTLLGKEGWRELDAAASEVPPGSDGVFVIPHLKQRGTDEEGLRDRESIVGLETSHGPDILFRAFLEGVAYRLREGYEPIEGEVGRILLAGGGARSAIFASIIASVLGRELVLTPDGGASGGMALLAAWSLGFSPSLDALVGSWFSKRRIIESDPEAVTYYTRAYPRYKKIVSVIDDLYRIIDR
ncbi:FGGY-family carbohydrate kinase [Sediminispirochaeta smaragdinae]|uniref:Carbohydrate kinase, FGGY n=1 Tax=Sediminispirochaeta smaragdinae (strain DSM 11293 / JCM 15392 / SEBR 4228) TaxID=573413 RepID=E1R8T4_SEDSS|nr:FGGY family carbohydrate kinase [Sediminispirochaeta smaragdinae]ADK81841.1 Carbohydrate kinase, FGGY [Sediminispirochaeta smaragdinae DSM 11293]